MALRVNVVCLIALLLAVITLSFADDEHGTDAVSYDKEKFQAAVTEKHNFVMFFAPWCGHCKRLAPTWDELAKKFNNDDSGVTIAKVDCTVDTALCADHDVTGYPTLKFFRQGGDKFERYKGGRDLESLQKFVEEQSLKVVDDDGDQAGEGGDGATLDLSEDVFRSFVQNGLHFVKFYAPWCGHCKRLAPTWVELAEAYADSDAIAISKVDCTVSSKLCSDEGIKGYPTLLLYKDGHKVDQYQEGRSLDDLKSYVKRKLAESGDHVDHHEEQLDDIPDEHDAETPVMDLTEDTFKDVIGDGLTFVKFFAPWCGHCKRLAPTWEELGQAYQGKSVVIARVDCTQHKPVCSENEVQGYPTLVMFQNGVRLENYKGQRTLEELQKFVDKHNVHVEL